jgi:hypothetical protein
MLVLGLKNPQELWKNQQKPSKNYGDPRMFNDKLGFNEVYS